MLAKGVAEWIKKRILEILEGAKDDNGEIPMSLVRKAFEKIEEPCTDAVSRQAAIAIADSSDYVWLSVEDVKKVTDEVVKGLKKLPPAEQQYEPVTAEDFARTMSENTLYSFMAWHLEALELMKKQGFVICKKTM